MARKWNNDALSRPSPSHGADMTLKLSGERLVADSRLESLFGAHVFEALSLVLKVFGAYTYHRPNWKRCSAGKIVGFQKPLLTRT